MQMRSIHLETAMQRILNRILKRNVSTKRVEDTASMLAVSALDRRVQHMMALQATQPLPQIEHFKHISNPI
jgi:hypothetical protein